MLEHVSYRKPLDINFPNPVRTRDDFFDRQPALDHIYHILQSAARRPLVFIGERKTGKTSMLNVINEWLKYQLNTEVLLMPHVYTRDQFAAEILHGIGIKSGLSVRQSALMNQDGQFRLATPSEFVSAAENVLRQQPRMQYVLCIDELDSLLERCSDQDAQEILALMLHLIEKTELPLRFVFTMTLLSKRILRAYDSQFLLSANLIRLDHWAYDDACACAKWLFQNHVSFDEDALERLFEASGGHPYFLKAILQQLLDRHSFNDSTHQVSAAMVDTAIQESLDSPEVEYTLVNITSAHFSANDIRILLACHTAAKPLTERELVSYGESREVVRDTVRELVQRGYLYPVAPDRYRLRQQMIGLWLERRYEYQDVSSPSIPTALLVVDDQQGRIFLAGNDFRTSPTETRLLRSLARRSGQVVPKEVVAREGWSDEVYQRGFGDDRIDQTIARLRKKLRDASYPDLLETRPGHGYILHNAVWIPNEKDK